jgi:regulatory protein
LAYATIKRGSSKDGYFAVPLEGSSFFISFTQAAQLGLRDSQELSEDEFCVLRDKMLGSRCRLKAMDYLARREHGRRELALKLQQKDFPTDIIHEQLDRLEAERLLSDERFATQFVISRQRKNPEGQSVLVMRLMQKGIDRMLAEKVVTEWFCDEAAVMDAIRRAIKRSVRKSGTDKIRLSSELRKKGFSTSEVQQFFEALDD